MSRTSPLLAPRQRLYTESPSDEVYEQVVEAVRDLRMKTFAMSIKLFEPLKTPVITPDNVDFVVMGWVHPKGAFAACAKMATIPSDEGLLPILDVYRLCRYDIEINRVDADLIADAWVALTTPKPLVHKLVLREGDVWVDPELTREGERARAKGLTADNWGIQLSDYDGSRVVHSGVQPLKKRLYFGLLDVVLPWW